VCYVGKGTPSTGEMKIGHGFPLANQPDKGVDRDLTYQFRAGLSLERPLCYHRRQLRGAIWGIPDKDGR